MDLINTITDDQQINESPQCSAKINTPVEKKLHRTGKLNPKFKNRKFRPWKKWMAQTARIKYTLPPTEPEESSYNLINLFHMSSDIICPTANRQQGCSVNIFNMPPVYKAKIEEPLKSEVSSTIKVEILNTTAKQQPIEKTEFPKSEIIVISDSESEIEDTSFENEISKNIKNNNNTNYENTRKMIPSIPAKHNRSQLNSEYEILNWPTLQKTKTEEYLKSQSLCSIKVEVLDSTVKQRILDKEEKYEIKEFTNSSQKALKPIETKVCDDTNANTSSHQIITVNIFHTPINNDASATDEKGLKIIKFEITNKPQEKCISTEDKNISDTWNSKKELQMSGSCEKSENMPTNSNIFKPSTINSKLSNTLSKEEAKSSHKLKIQIPRNETTNFSVNQSSETNFYKPGSPKKPLNFKQIVKLLRRVGEIPTQTPKNQKIKATATIPQIPSVATNTLTTTSSFMTLRQRRMELHRLRVQVEQKRLDLLDLKLARERQEMERSKAEYDRNSKTTRFEVIKLDDSVDI